MTASPGPAPQDPADRFLAALARGDRSRALGVVTALRAEGMSPLEVLTTVVAPAQVRVGEHWARDEWTVAQEHVATAVSESVVAAVSAEVAGRDAADPGDPVVVACVEHEWHALPALLVAEHLRDAGVPVHYLGAHASSAHLVRHVHQVAPRAVALSASLVSSLPRVRQEIEAVRETGTPVVVGGAAFDAEGHRARTLGATAFARSGRELVGLLDALPGAVPAAEPLTDDGARECAILHADREVVAEDLARTLDERLPDPDGAWSPVLHEQLVHLVGALAGALLTGDRRVVDDAFAWLGEVMAHRGAPEALVPVLRAALVRRVAELPVAARVLGERP